MEDTKPGESTGELAVGCCAPADGQAPKRKRVAILKAAKPGQDIRPIGSDIM